MATTTVRLVVRWAVSAIHRVWRGGNSKKAGGETRENGEGMQGGWPGRGSVSKMDACSADTAGG